MNESLRKVNNTRLQFIVLGDFNTSYLNRPAQQLLDLIHLYDLHQMITEPTRVTENTSTCLDLILTQNRQLVKSVEVISPLCSDHSVSVKSVEVMSPICSDHSVSVKSVEVMSPLCSGHSVSVKPVEVMY